MKDRSCLNNHWSTPRDFHSILDQILSFTPEFDPCPLGNDIEIFNGLTAEWPESVYLNPPYTAKDKSAFILKAIEQASKGTNTIALIPVSTSTVLYHDHIIDRPHYPLRGRLKFEGITSDGKWANAGAGIGRHPANDFDWAPSDFVIKHGQHDSMLVIIQSETGNRWSDTQLDQVKTISKKK